jgi:NAD(P)-dependent dehydrogenase (short-subunit alcohol dehydrogenase family)
MLLERKTALITGAGSGIGRATALAFAHSGASVMLADIHGAAETAELVKSMGGKNSRRQVRRHLAGRGREPDRKSHRRVWTH